MLRSRLVRAISLLGVAFVLAAPGSAAPDDDGDWTLLSPPGRSTGTAAAPTTTEGGYTSSDRERFDQQMKRGLIDFDQFCRQVRIPLSYNLGSSDFSGTGGGVSRYLLSDVDGTFALIDDENLHASFSHEFPRTFSGGVAAGLSAGGSISGHSMVIRRTGTKKSCDDVLRVADLRDVKTVLPMTAKRISGMGLGELWRVPFTLTYSQGVSAGDGFGAAGAGVSVSFGREDEGTASMTLYRVADDKVRFRFRIDHVVVYSRSLGLTETYPAAVYAADSTNILLHFLQQQAADQLGRYTSAWLTLGQADSDGKNLLMEFVADPRDPAQAEALAKALRGDFEELIVFGARMSTLQTARTMSDYKALRGRQGAKLGPSTYSASDEYASKTRSFAISLPFLVQHNATTLLGDDHISRYTGDEGEFRAFKVDRTGNNSFIDLPFLGPQVKDNGQRDVETVVYAPKGGASGDPIVVYIRNQGYFHETGSTVREPVLEINRMLGAAGAQRGADGRRLLLPVDRLVPPPAPVPPARTSKSPPPSEPGDRKGMLSFTLAFDQRAVRDILAAPAAEVLRAFSAALGAPEKPLMDWLIAHGTLDRENRLDFSRAQARTAFPWNPRREPGEADPARTLAGLSGEAAALLDDLASARGAKDNAVRARDLAMTIGGKARSELAYEDSLRVLIQLVDPLDLSGDFVADIQSGSRDVKSANNHLVLKKGRAEFPLLKEAGDAKNRFAQPSILVD